MRNRLYLKHLFTATAAFSAAATLITALFDVECVKNCWIYGAIGLLLVCVASIIYASWQTRSTKNITLSMSSELKLDIEEGDLFNKKGVICIPVNEYFDTHVGDGVIKEDSIHGMFINRFFKDRIEELKSKIEVGLSSVSYKTHKRRLDICPNKQYQLGTCVNIRDGENTYVLFALTHFNDADKAYVGRAEYSEVLRSLMKHLSNIAETRPVFMPLFGTGLSRLSRTPQRILYHLVDELDFDDESRLPGGLNIVIKSLSKTGVNLTMMEYVVNEGIAEAKNDNDNV